ncbi:zinc transporter ZIP11 isoform X6 [Tenrec ecaudatus]|uniref:zinc transporter ZIP11 isoform X6 n=1 Tax=Tenrec ecaudatus TaxID=94439 RepID=UPI003F59BC15
MLRGQSAVLQALLGTFFTWGLTAAGAALVFIFSSGQRRILDGSLGFAAGVMLAASYWSLLAPAIEMAMSSGGFGAFAFLPVAVGFTLGAAFVYLADLLMPHLGAAEDPQTALALSFDPKLVKKSDAEGPSLLFPERELSIRIGRAGLLSDKSENGEAYQRRRAGGLSEDPVPAGPSRGSPGQPAGGSWRRITLLILAITIHNVPGAKGDLPEYQYSKTQPLTCFSSGASFGTPLFVCKGAASRQACFPPCTHPVLEAPPHFHTAGAMGSPWG